MSSSSRNLSDLSHAIALAAALAAAACSNEKSKLDGDDPWSRPAASAAPAKPTVPEAEAQAFCEKTMQKVLACFDDERFWDTFSTTWFAKYPDDSGNPDAKKMWIGMRKDDIAGLKHEGQLAQNCTVMVQHNRLPTAADMKPVTAAMEKSCADFGTAMGFMLFHTGVFHLPR